MGFESVDRRYFSVAMADRLAIRHHFIHAIISLAIIFSFYSYIRSVIPQKNLQHQLMLLNVRMMTMNFTNLAQVSLDPQQLRQDEFTSYVSFFEKFVEFFPQNAEVHALLGFCRHYLGNNKNAIKNYHNAAILVPDDFWFSYNLGLILFKENNFKEAQKFFKQAARANLKKTIERIQRSTVYPPVIFYDSPRFKQEILSRLERAYEQNWLLLIYSAHLNRDNIFVSDNLSQAFAAAPAYRDIFLYYAAEAAANLNDWVKAKRLFKAVTKLNPELKKEFDQMLKFYKNQNNRNADAARLIVFKTYLPEKLNLKLEIF